MMGSLAATVVAAGGGGGKTDPGSFEHVRRSLVYGTVTASFTVESVSLDRLRDLSRNQLDARYNEYAAMVRV
jgi:hypothetical protein